ncbi:MAG: D-arabinono-1,4-lactone oxidase, partial [Solirubrobacteraceae bacterium]
AWKNHRGNQRITPLRIYEPATIDEVADIVTDAERHGVTARAVGSGHSWSDAALTEGYLMETRKLSRVPAHEPDFLREEWAARTLVRAEAGTRIRDLNAYLDRNGLALSQMGGYDKQTIAGVMSTSTHGSGTAYGPLNDSVHSVDLVASGGRIHRVERAGGPTDRAAYEAHHGDSRTLHQDDHVFHAVAVAVGCMGVLCTALVEVREKFYLREVRELHPWSKVRADLEDGAVLRDNDHYEFVFSPYARKHEYPCLVTTRNPVADPRHRPWDKRMRNWVIELLSTFPFTSRAINLVLHLWPALAPMLLENAMKALVKDEYDNVSYKVFNIGNANLVPALSSEIAVPLDGRHIAAVERIFEVADEYRRLGDIYQSAPISMRFVKASPAYLSMMHGQDTVMLELIQLNGNEGGFELTNAYEKALYELAGRPHWGQLNTLTGSHGLVESMYPRYADWQDVHRQFNASGVFDSPFSKRVGISADRFKG